MRSGCRWRPRWRCRRRGSRDPTGSWARSPVRRRRAGSAPGSLVPGRWRTLRCSAIRRRTMRSVTSLRTIASTTAMAIVQSPQTSAAMSPTTVPTTRLPSCIGPQSGQYSQPGRPLMARKTRCSRGWISGSRAPATDAASTTAPTTAIATIGQSISTHPACRSTLRVTRRSRSDLGRSPGRIRPRSPGGASVHDAERRLADRCLVDDRHARHRRRAAVPAGTNREN